MTKFHVEKLNCFWKILGLQRRRIQSQEGIKLSTNSMQIVLQDTMLLDTLLLDSNRQPNETKKLFYSSN